MADELDEQRARALVQRYPDITDIRGGDAWVITSVEEVSWGLVVHWANRRAAGGSRGLAGQYAGSGPYLADRRSGQVALCGSAHPVQHYVDLWRRGQWPVEPPPEGLDPLPEPWFDLRPRPGGAYAASRLAMTAELARGLMPGHILHGEHAEALAKCSHCDSVLYELPGERFALVHLTWARRPEQPPYPETGILTSWVNALEALGKHNA